jgi:VanZ family protein
MSLLVPRKINRLGLAVFAAATAFTLYAALAPGDDTKGLIPWDKAKHFIVFYGLTFLATLALPKSRFWKIGLVLLGFGIGIEILQGLPIIGRDADIFDVVADTCGVGFFFGPILVRAWLDGGEADQA